MGKKLLVETQSVQVQLLEAEAVGGDKKFLHFIAEIQRADVKNQNGRVYPRSIVEREVALFQKKINERRSVGEADHPEKAPSISRSGVLWEKVWIESDGRVMGQAKVVETAVGKDLKALLEAGVRVGVSSRSKGSVRLGEWKGEQAEVVQDDLEMVTFDVVSDPSVATAVSDRTFVEQRMEKSVMHEDIKDLASFKAKYPALHDKLVQEAVAAASAKFEPTLNAIVERKTGEIRKQVMAEMAEKGHNLSESDLGRMGRADSVVKTLVTLLTEAEFVKDGVPTDEETKSKMDALTAEVAAVKTENAKLSAALAEATEIIESGEAKKEIDAAITEAVKPVNDPAQAQALKETLSDAIRTKEDIKNIPDVTKRFTTLVESLTPIAKHGIGKINPITPKQETAPIKALNESKKAPEAPGLAAQRRAAGIG